MNVFAKLSGEFMPYAMYTAHKTTAFAFTTPADKPMTSIKLHAKNGNIDLFLVRVKLCNNYKLEHNNKNVLFSSNVDCNVPKQHLQICISL